MMLGKAVGAFPNLTSQSSLMFEGLYYSANCPEEGRGEEESIWKEGLREGKRKKQNGYPFICKHALF